MKINYSLIVMCVFLRSFECALDSGEEAELQEVCCSHGLTRAMKAPSVAACQSIDVPEDIEPENKDFCKTAAAGCCRDHFQTKDECLAGMKYADTKQCTVPESEMGKYCCEECSFGRLTGESQGKTGCGELTDDGISATSALRVFAYFTCCVEAAEKAETTTIETIKETTTETIVETTTPKKEVKKKCKTDSCGHICNDEDGKVRCQCHEGFRLQSDKKTCKDINECAEAIDDLCTAEDTVCHNTDGSFKCVPIKKRELGTCPPGFKRNVLNQVCDDINECQLPRPPCPKYLCENTIGGYKCGGKPGKPFEEAAPIIPAAPVAPVASRAPSKPVAEDPTTSRNDICPTGFRSGPDDECIDIDECEERLDDCQRLSQHCINTHGSFFCQDHVSRRCAPGFKANTATGICEDIDECEESSEVCRRTEVCVNLPGAYNCKSKISTLPKLAPKICQEGTRVKPGGTNCEDIDECREGTHLCDQFQNCINSYGGHECRCKNGFELDSASGACVDIDECAQKLDNCAAGGLHCLNVLGAFTCTRRPAPTTPRAHTTSSTTPTPIYDYYYDSDEDNSTTPEDNYSEIATKPTPSRPVQPPLPSLPPYPGSSTYPRRPIINATSTPRTPYTNKPETPRYLRPTVRTTSTTTTASPKPAIPEPNDNRSAETPVEPEHVETRPKPHHNIPIPSIPEEKPTDPPSKPDHPEVPENQPTNDPSRRPVDKPTNEPSRRPEERPTTGPDDKPIYNPSTRPSYDPYGRPENRPTYVPSRMPESRPSYEPSERPSDPPTYDPPRRPSRPETPSRRPEYTPSRPETLPRRPEYSPSRPTYPSNRPTDNSRRPEKPTEVIVPLPNNPNVIEKDRDLDGSYGLNTSEIPKNEWTNVIGRDRPEEPDFDINNIHCLNGFERNDQGNCVDINECEDNKHICSNLEICVNAQGGYRCDCMSGFKRDASGWCVPARPPSTTPKPTTTTSTTVRTTTKPTQPTYEETPWWQYGSPRRPDTPMTCEMGYSYDTELRKCVDIDECAIKNICSRKEQCFNIEGGYYCRPAYERVTPSPPLSPPREPFYPPSPHEYPSAGREPESNVITVGAQYGQTGPRYLRPTFSRMPQSGAIVTSCPWGYKLTADKMCYDIDECAKNVSQCGPTQRCENFFGGYSCQCPAGHKLFGKDSCEDVDECRYGRPCSYISKCVNTVGSFRCECNEGYRNSPSNDKVCTDVDECTETPTVCHQNCANVWGGYRCYCKRGYRLDKDNRTCVDVDECSEWKESHAHGRARLCAGDCVNEPGSYRCSCPRGYRLSDDNRGCIDIDECETGEAPCASSHDPGYVCQNTRGSYHCHRIECPRGYRLEDKHRCNRIQRSCPISDQWCLQQPSAYSYNFITFVANLYLPTGSVDLFTMHGPSWRDSVVSFELRMIGVHAGPGAKPADLRCFDMRPMDNVCVISLLCSLEGPQVAELELTMSLYQHSQFAGNAVARLIIIVSEYEF